MILKYFLSKSKTELIFSTTKIIRCLHWGEKNGMMEIKKRREKLISCQTSK